MSYNFLDVLPDDILSKILSFNVDIIEQEIIKLEIALIRFISLTSDGEILIDITNEKDYYNDDDENDNYLIPYIVHYNDIIYRMDDFFLSKTPYENIRVFIQFRDENDNLCITMSNSLENPTYYNLVQETYKLVLLVMAYFRYHKDTKNYKYYEDNRVIEGFIPYPYKYFGNCHLLMCELPYNENIIYLEPYFIK